MFKFDDNPNNYPVLIIKMSLTENILVDFMPFYSQSDETYFELKSQNVPAHLTRHRVNLDHIKFQQK